MTISRGTPSVFWHKGPSGKIHASDGLTILTRCGLHPSRAKGWQVLDAVPWFYMPANPCGHCF